MSQLVIVEAFTAMPDTRHTQALCLALFTLSVTAGNRGFLAIGEWLWVYHDEWVAMGITVLREAYRLKAQFGRHSVATRLPGLLGLFISILGHSTFAL
ncbi:hypothetical protein [Microcoleus sp. OTE_8_concoct_300]|uniref:hypothetical protein n=1 Tax=Microcoleus sp. OTE_8_concoct_300 TaxID=2964710 RepID=UPI00403F8BF5